MKNCQISKSVPCRRTDTFSVTANCNYLQAKLHLPYHDLLNFRYCFADYNWLDKNFSRPGYFRWKPRNKHFEYSYFNRKVKRISRNNRPCNFFFERGCCLMKELEIYGTRWWDEKYFSSDIKDILRRISRKPIVYSIDATDKNCLKDAISVVSAFISRGQPCITAQSLRQTSRH